MNKVYPQITIDVDITNTAHVDFLGEYYLKLFNKKLRWGYSTFSFDDNVKAIKLKSCKELSFNYEFAELDNDFTGAPSYWYVEAEDKSFLVGIYWDGDGDITIYNIDSNIMLNNTDCKCSYGWTTVQHTLF